jgi:flagellar protein FlaG
MRVKEEFFMINQVQPVTQSTLIPLDAFPGQKQERSKDTPRKIVDRKLETSSAREEIPREQVEKAAEKLNRLMGIIDKSIEFRVNEGSQSFMVKIIDQQSGDILDEIPPEQIMDIFGSFSQAAGLIFDKLV